VSLPRLSGSALFVELALALSACLLLLMPGHARAAIIEKAPEPGAPGLPDGRVYEQVTPAAKNGNQAGPGAPLGNAYGLSTADGSRVLYSSTGPIGEAHSGVDNFSVSERTASGWTTKAVLPAPPPTPPRDPVSPFDPIWLLPSSDLLSAAFVAHNPFTQVNLDFADPAFSFASTYLSHDDEPAEWLGAPTVEDPFPALEHNTEPSDLALAGAASNLETLYYEYYGTLLPEDAPRRPTVAEENTFAWGLYGWHDGHLKAAGILPPEEKLPSGEANPYAGEEDPYGAIAAALGQQPLGATPADFDNEVSSNGSTLLFVSPAPESGSGRTPQLYARLNGATSVLVSRSGLTGLPSLNGPDAITGLSGSGLVSYAYGSPDGSHVFFASQEQLTSNAPTDSSIKEYQFDLATATLSYLPGVTAPILASSDDGSTVVFDDAESGELAMWSGGHVTAITPLPTPSEEGLYVSPVRLAANASELVFQTNSPIPGFNNGEGLGEVYRYDLNTNGLSCVSCPPEGQMPLGSANLSDDDLHHSTHLVSDSRGVSEDGSEIFFDTPDQLVPEDENRTRDVYEWHDSRLSLISSGKGNSESFFLDNSASGDDVFFATSDNLSGSDTDGSYDVYDARVDGGFPQSTAPVVKCSGSCPAAASTLPPVTTLASTGPLGEGEQVPGLVSVRSGHKRVISRAQALAKSLRACKKKRGRRRRTCEKQARRRYGKYTVERRK
jgi:hypothetical protein